MNLMVKMGRGLAHVWTSTGRILALIGVCLFAAAGFAAESISITATPRYPWNGKVDLKFTIDGTSGTKYDTSFTAKDVAGGTSLTLKTLYKSNGVAANVAKEQLLPGTYNWVWDATADLGEGTVLEKVVVEGKTNAPLPLYMVVDLSKWAISYLDNVPSGGWGTAYKQEKLVLRRCDPGTFMMQGNRKVTLTKTFYIGVYEMTVKQFVHLFNYAPGDQDADLSFYWNQAVGCISYNTANTVLTTLSKKTGRTFSLPTEAQWEYACRAGTTSTYNGGTSSISGLADYGRDITELPGNVGRYIANNWGIYDMHGNVRELVKDYYGSLGKDAVTDPKGPTSGSQRVYRGGSFSDAASACTSSSRGGVSPELGSYYGPDYSSKDIEQQGFRVCIEIQ